MREDKGERRESMHSDVRAVITGLGAITPIGLTVEDFWANLTAGVSGVGHITLFDASEFPVRIAAEVKGFEPTKYMDFKLARRFSRPAQFAVAVSRMAIEDAALIIGDENAHRVGVVMNTGGGGIGELEKGVHVLMEKGARFVSPFLIPNIMPNVVSCLVSIVTGAKGPIITSTAACASGNYAFFEALRLLRLGEADALIAGGTEAGIIPLAFAAFGRMGAL
ncbi:MAG: beta-ketoacyl-[acyl-carrier-protein] synthase family protein, partial [Nitrospinota bacterium]